MMDVAAATDQVHVDCALGTRVSNAAPTQLGRTVIRTPPPTHAQARFVTTMLDASVELRDVQIAARHADPRTTRDPHGGDAGTARGCSYSRDNAKIAAPTQPPLTAQNDAAVRTRKRSLVCSPSLIISGQNISALIQAPMPTAAATRSGRLGIAAPVASKGAP